MDELNVLLQYFYMHPSKTSFSKVFVCFMDMNEDEEPILVAVCPDQDDFLTIMDDHGNQYYVAYSDPEMVPAGIRTIMLSVFELNKKVFQDEDCFGISVNPEQEPPALILKGQMNSFFTLAEIIRNRMS